VTCNFIICRNCVKFHALEQGTKGGKVFFNFSRGGNLRFPETNNKKENNEESQQGALRHDFSAQRAWLAGVTNNEQ
jgi:hypothetical protein